MHNVHAPPLVLDRLARDEEEVVALVSEAELRSNPVRSFEGLHGELAPLTQAYWQARLALRVRYFA